jgi:hypothetical protein
VPVSAPVFHDDLSLPPSSWQSLARFTAFSTTEAGNLVWATDDSLGLGRQALLVTLSTQAGIYSVPYKLSPNPVRNIIKLDPDIFFTISQSSTNIHLVDFNIIDLDNNKKIQFLLPNVCKKIHAITNSLGSSICRDGFFFFPSTGSLLTDKFGIFRVACKINR